MFRKLFALEIAALSSGNDVESRPDRNEPDTATCAREAFTPRTGNYGSMWSMRSFG